MYMQFTIFLMPLFGKPLAGAGPEDEGQQIEPGDAGWWELFGPNQEVHILSSSQKSQKMQEPSGGQSSGV